MTTKQSKRKKEETKKNERPAPDVDGPAAVSAPESDAGGAPEETPEERLAALDDRLLRLQADFDNYRKRTLRERETERLRSNEDLMLELLPILDHLEMGIRTAEEQSISPSVLQGFRMVLDQALGAMKKFGLEPIDAVGHPFDPHRHESVAMAPSESIERDRVLSQIRRGYRLGAQLLRPAQVVLSLGAPEQDPAAETADAFESESGEKTE